MIANCLQSSYTLKPFSELNPYELYEILRLRSEIFVVEQQCIYQDLDRLDFKALHLFQQDDQGAVLAYTRLLPQGLDFDDACAIGRVVVDARFRKNQLGRQIMQQSIDLCKEFWPNLDIAIHAQTYLLSFYSSLGFVAYGEEFLEDGLPHRFMRIAQP